jgi:ParB family chromosome partitioning protein
MSPVSKGGLGRGFESLLPQSFDKTLLLTEDDRIVKVPLKDIVPNPNQPRKNFDSKALESLAESIKSHGVIQPILVTPSKTGGYQIVAGERRWRASKLAGLKHVPAVVHERKELDQIEVALTENIQRENLSPIDQAITYEKLHQQFNISYDDIAKRLGRGSSTIANIVRLLALPENAKQALMDNKITEGHARQILAIVNGPEQQNYLLHAILKYGWNVRQSEQYVTGLKSGIKESEKAKAMTVAETAETKMLSKKLNTPVTIRRMAHGGKLEITYKDDKHLENIISRITSE